MIFDILYRKEIKRLNDKHCEFDKKIEQIDKIVDNALKKKEVRFTTIDTDECARISSLESNPDILEIFSEYIEYISGLMDNKFFKFFLTDIREELLFNVSNGELPQIELGKLKQYDHILKQIGKFGIFKAEIIKNLKEGK